MTIDQILEDAWGPEFRGELSYVKTYVSLLRGKLEENPRRPRYIVARPGFGYLFDPKGRAT